MEVVFAEDAKLDLSWWKASGNAKALTKISALIEAIQISPFNGIGKPELLKHQFAGMWSRRINSEHRIVYKLYPDKVIIISLKGHYE